MLYTERIYGNALYADKAGSGTEDHYLDLMKYLPDYWQNMREMKLLQRAIGFELWTAKDFGDNLLDQTFLDTATWALTLWETVYGLETDLTKSYEFRRERLRAKIRGAGTTTKAMVENVASSFANGEAKVLEYPQENLFIVKFVGVKGVPANMQDLTAAIEEIKPAHLTFRYEYTYNYWNGLKSQTWNDLKPHTWNQIRTI